MSDFWVQYVPAEPDAQPDPAAANKAKTLLRAFTCGADGIDASFYDRIEVFHPGGNWSGVNCPHCGSGLEDWWPKAMDKAHETNFRDRAVTTPCCGTQTSLDKLHYPWALAFGRFALQATNPSRELTPDEEEKLSACLGLQLRKVRVHI